jgi:WXXGXW repeat (2 copies)
MMSIGLARNGRNRGGSKDESGRAAMMALMVLFGALGFLVLEAAAQDPGANPVPGQGFDAGSAADPDQNVQVLTRGPVHEAFAAPVAHDPTPGLVVAKAPPAPVEELPPDQKPAGQNVQWISGYWSWDQSRDDFLWVSGVWREPPPGRQWVPGYWRQVERGYQWVPGAWVPVSQNAGGGPVQAASGPQAAYLPSPPASLETGPNGPAPMANVFWSPGSWYWQENRYVWRPGFWAAVQPSWVWIPAHFVWTPAGCLFVEGYWDMPLASRGLIFAPVYYAQPVYLQPAYVFTPSITIATPGLVANLFVQPSYSHYCFGDYYDRTFISVGIVPWFSLTYASGPGRPVYYDPLFSFYATVNLGRDPGWATRVRQEYVVRRDNVAMRPPRTYIEQTRIIERNVTVINSGRGRDSVMARPIHQLASHSEAAGGMRLERVSTESRRQWQERGVELRQFREQRAHQEQQASTGRPAGPGEGRSVAQASARPLALPASPVAAPIHQHGATGESIGPMSHSQHHVPAGGTGEHFGPRYEQPGVRVARQPAAGESRAPLIQHQAAGVAPGSDHLDRLGQAAPHDVARTPSAGPGPAFGGREPTSRPEPPRLHAPPQYTHRQPPPPPRPAARRESQEGRRGP